MSFLSESRHDTIEEPIDPTSLAPVIRRQPSGWQSPDLAAIGTETFHDIEIVRRETIESVEQFAESGLAKTVLGALASGPRDLYEVASHCELGPEEALRRIAALLRFGIVTQDFGEESPFEAVYTLHQHP